MKILVTGATGFVGRALIALLLAKKKDEVFALVRSISNRSLIPQGVEVIEGDLFSQSSLKRILERVDVVVHLACEMDFYPKSPMKMFKTNVEGTRNLALAADAAGIKRFIFVSTTEVMSPTPKDAPADEESPYVSVYDYGISKKLGEEEVKNICETSRMEYTIIRPTGILGPGDFSAANQLFWAVNFGLFFFVPSNASGKICFTHLSDVVKGIEIAIHSEKAKDETFILSADPLTYKEVITISAKESGRIEPLFTVPGPIVHLGMMLMKPFFLTVFPKRFMFEPKTLEQMSSNRWYSNRKAKELLGWSPAYSFEDAIKDTISVQLRIGELQKRSYSMFFVIVLMIFAILLIFWIWIM